MRVLKWVLAASFAAALGTAAFFYQMESEDVARAKHQLAETEQRLQQLAAITEQIEIYEGNKSRLAHGLAIVQALRVPSRSELVLSGEHLRRLSKGLPRPIELDRVLIQGKLVAVSGRADAAGSVNRWGQTLAGEGLLSDFELRSFEPPAADRSRGAFTFAGTLSDEAFPALESEAPPDALEPSAPDVPGGSGTR